MTARRPCGRRSGIAIPLVVIFCGVMAILVYTLTQTRIEQKRQNITQFNALQAHYLAQGAVQHALLKFRVLPTEAYAATALARGLCPFHVAGPGTKLIPGTGKTPEALDAFVKDINSDRQEGGVDLAFKSDEFKKWHYGIVNSRAITSFTTGTETVNVVAIEAVGWVPMWLKDPLSGDWDSKLYEDRVKKTVEIRRTR